MDSKILEAIRAEIERLGGPVYTTSDHLMVPIPLADTAHTVHLLKIFASDEHKDVHLSLRVAAVAPERVAFVRQHLDQLNSTYAYQRWTLEDGVVMLTWTVDFIGDSAVKIVMLQIGRMIGADEHHRLEILQIAQARRQRRPRAVRQAERIVCTLP